VGAVRNRAGRDQGDLSEHGLDLWRELAPGWEEGRELRWRATRGVDEWLVERLDPQPGQTILELAAGMGETGFLAAERLGSSGRLITSDAEPAMLAAAERLAQSLGLANVELRVLDSTRIGLPPASVDGVLSRFGYVLRGDPPAALHEVRRVLRPGGRFAFAVWAERSRNPWMTVPLDVMVERGHLAPPGPDESALSDRRTPSAIESLLEAAGFAEPRIEEMPVRYRFEDPDELWTFVESVRGQVSLEVLSLPVAERNVIRAEIEERARAADGGYELAGVSLNVVTS
jgi:ubiquinone/menaquinone biosynthesis C-methylase UbiE